VPVVSIVLPIGIPCCYQIIIIVVAVFSPLMTIPSATRVVLRLVIVFIITTLPWPSYVVFTISPAVGDFH
jgi:hypothetical protein